MMKKIISLLIVTVMLLSCFSFAVSAASDGVVKAGRVSAKPGDEITIPVVYTDNPGVYIIRVTVSYDERAVEFVELNKSASDHFNYTINSEAQGSIVVLMDGQSMSNVDEDLELFELKFKVKKEAPAGRVLFPVYCSKENGDATALQEENSSITPVSLSPATSTGSLTVLCSEHTFDLQTSDGGVQCSKCGAVKEADGDVSVDVNAGLPEVDVSASSSAGADSASGALGEPQGNGGNEADGERDGGLTAGHFIPIIAAVIIAVLIPVVVVIIKRKKSGSAEQDKD